MPSTSEAQRKFMGMELGKLRKGTKTETGMSEKQLSEFAKKPIAKKKLRGGKSMRGKR